MYGSIRGALLRGAMLLLMLLTTPAWAKIGHVERAKGEVKLELAGGDTRALNVGDSLEETQTLRTGADGEAVVRFVDNALLVLRPNSQVQLSRYRFQENDPSSYTALRLVRGGLRFVTGLVGKMNHDQVQVNTPVATIGIRGTDFDTVFRDNREGSLDAGTYTCVSQGGTYMRDDEGRTVEIAQGQTAFVTSADFIARGLAGATRFGLIKPPAGLFRAGTFDGQLQELKQEGLRRLQDKISDNVPAQLRGVVPSEVTGMIGGLFGGKKKAEQQAEAGCAS